MGARPKSVRTNSDTRTGHFCANTSTRQNGFWPSKVHDSAEYAEITRTHRVSKSGSSPVGHSAPSPARLWLRRVLSGPRGRRSGNRFSTQPAIGLTTWLKARGESSTSLPILPDSVNHCNAIGVEISLQRRMFSAAFWAGEIRLLVVSSRICACSSTG